MSTEAPRADIPPRPASPPPPLASSRLPDHAPAADRVPADSLAADSDPHGSASLDFVPGAALPPRPAGGVPVRAQNDAESARSGRQPTGLG
ncbi:hypothetical protein ABT367_04885, partial [Streptomyces mesophilus]